MVSGKRGNSPSGIDTGIGIGIGTGGGTGTGGGLGRFVDVSMALYRIGGNLLRRIC